MIDKSEIVYKFRKSYHISYNQDYFCCVGATVNLYDIKSGDLVTTFKGMRHLHSSKFISDRKLVVKTNEGFYYIFDLATNELVKVISPPKNVKTSTTDFEVTSDGKYIIDFSYIFPTKKLMVAEIETGEYTFFDLGFSRSAAVFSTENEFKYYIVSACAEELNAPDVNIRDFYELTYKSDKFELKKLFSDSDSRMSNKDYSAGVFAVADYSDKIKIFDIQKAFNNTVEYEKSGVLYDLKLSKNGRLIALAEAQNIYVYDISTNKCIKSFEVDYGNFVDFFDNDTKLLIGTWEKGYCVVLNIGEIQ